MTSHDQYSCSDESRDAVTARRNTTSVDSAKESARNSSAVVVGAETKTAVDAPTIKSSSGGKKTLVKPPYSYIALITMSDS